MVFWNQLMKRIIIQALILTACLAAPPVLAGSQLVVKPTEYDFGYIPQNSKVAFSFWLHSAGDADLKIARVLPGCGCTRAPLEKDVVAPGDSARLEIIFDSGRYMNRVVKRPGIYVEGESEPHLVTISSFVVPPTDSTSLIKLKPYKLDISQYGETVRDRGTISLTNLTAEDLELTLVCGPEGYGKLSLPEKVKAGGTVKVELVLDEAVLGESFEKSFTFELSDEHHSRYTVPVRRTVRDPNARQLTAPGGSR
jgi:hypothetical protein